MAATTEFTGYFGEGFTLRNRIFIVRHGLVRLQTTAFVCGSFHNVCAVCLLFQAESNVKRVLCTKPEVGTTAWGLVEEGKKQAKNVSPRHFFLTL